MARIDINQPLTNDDEGKITEWLYRQNGIDHVLCNPVTRIVVFTFFPVKTTGDKIASDFTSQLGYKALRFVPSEAEMKAGCPVAATSFTYKAYNLITHIF